MLLELHMFDLFARIVVWLIGQLFTQVIERIILQRTLRVQCTSSKKNDLLKPNPVARVAASFNEDGRAVAEQLFRGVPSGRFRSFKPPPNCPLVTCEKLIYDFVVFVETMGLLKLRKHPPPPKKPKHAPDTGMYTNF